MGRGKGWLVLTTLCLILSVPLVGVAETIEQLFQQGNAAQAAGDYAQAESIWYKVILREPQNANAYTALGNALINLKRYGEAERAYRKAIELNPQYGPAGASRPKPTVSLESLSPQGFQS